MRAVVGRFGGCPVRNIRSLLTSARPNARLLPGRVKMLSVPAPLGDSANVPTYPPTLKRRQEDAVKCLAAKTH